MDVGLIHWDLLGANDANSTGAGAVTDYAKLRLLLHGWEWAFDCEFSSVDGLPAGLVGAGFHYSPFTAADGKIPLSMVQVKFKPLYVVICLRLQASHHKTLDFSCGKLIGWLSIAVQGSQYDPSSA